MRRDMDILCGHHFPGKYAFWDCERTACADMNWRMFASAFDFKERPSSGRE